MLTALRFETVALAKQMRQRGLDAPRLPLMLDLIGQLMAASHRIQHNLRPPSKQDSADLHALL